MECRDLKEILVQYSLGDIGQTEKLSVEEHLNSCDECRLFIAESNELWMLLERWDQLEPQDMFVSRFWDKVSAEDTEPKPGLLNWIRGFKLNWTLAGAMASIFLVSVVTFSVFSPDTANLFSSGDKQDALILTELENAASRETDELLAIYGPWDGSTDINGNGDIN